jgi:hypothetical protein
LAELVVGLQQPGRVARRRVAALARRGLSGVKQRAIRQGRPGAGTAATPLDGTAGSADATQRFPGLTLVEVEERLRALRPDAELLVRQLDADAFLITAG